MCDYKQFHKKQTLSASSITDTYYTVKLYSKRMYTVCGVILYNT